MHVPYTSLTSVPTGKGVLESLPACNARPVTAIGVLAVVIVIKVISGVRLIEIIRIILLIAVIRVIRILTPVLEFFFAQKKLP